MAERDELVEQRAAALLDALKPWDRMPPTIRQLCVQLTLALAVRAAGEEGAP